MSMDLAFEKVAKVFGKHHKYNLSFGLEYSSIVDWVCDITPRTNHPKARQYGEVWRAQATNPEDAILEAVKQVELELGN